MKLITKILIKNLENNIVLFDNIYRGCLYVSFIII